MFAIVALAIVAVITFVWFQYSSYRAQDKLNQVAGQLNKPPSAPCINLVDLQQQIDDMKIEIGRLSSRRSNDKTSKRQTSQTGQLEQSDSNDSDVYQQGQQQRPVIVDQRHRPPGPQNKKRRVAFAGAAPPSPSPTEIPNLPSRSVPPPPPEAQKPTVISVPVEKTQRKSDREILEAAATEVSISETVPQHIPKQKHQYPEDLEVIPEGDEENGGDASNGDL